MRKIPEQSLKDKPFWLLCLVVGLGSWWWAHHTSSSRRPPLAASASEDTVQNCCTDFWLCPRHWACLLQQHCLHSRWQPGRPSLRSAKRGDLFVPWTRTTRLGRWSFFIAAPVVWNSLPLHLCSPSISRSQFRAGLKTHLFRLAFRWLFLWELLKRLNRTKKSQMCITVEKGVLCIMADFRGFRSCILKLHYSEDSPVSVVQ